MKKDMIFLGGSLSSEKEIRQQIAPRAERIEELILECGYHCSLNMLGNKNIFSHEPRTKHPDFSNGQSFEKIGKRLLKKIPDRTIELVRGLRYVENEEHLKMTLMAKAIVQDQIDKAFAGIFEMSCASQGSIEEIIKLIDMRERQVLCLNHNEFGDRCFPVTLTGHPSPLLQTKKYNDDNLESIVKKFLLEDIKKRKVKTTTVMLTQKQFDRLDAYSKQENISRTKVIETAIDKYLCNGSCDSLRDETDRYIDFINGKIKALFC